MSVVNAASEMTGVSRSSIVVGLLMFAFIIFAASRGSLVKYRQIL